MKSADFGKKGNREPQIWNSTLNQKKRYVSCLSGQMQINEKPILKL